MRNSCHVGGDFGDGPPPQLTPALLDRCWSRRRSRCAEWIYRASSLTDSWHFALGLRVKADKREIMQSTCFHRGTKHLKTDVEESERWRARWRRRRAASFLGDAGARRWSRARLKMLFVLDLRGGSVQWVHSWGRLGGGEVLCRELKVTLLPPGQYGALPL